MKNIILNLSFFVFTINLFAQTPFEYEKSTGYSGSDIPELKHEEDSFSFLVLGDFGRVGDYYQKDVARELGNAMIVLESQFIVSVGDNFYPNGVQSIQDYHWISSYENVFTNPSLYADWYIALGNHDYRGNVQAQIDYSNISRRWNMPDRYYSKTFELEDGGKLLMVVMDTNPYIESYYENPEKYKGVNEQDTIAQRKWLIEKLDTKDPSIKWKIVVGHHPLYSGGMRKENPDTKSFESKFADLFDKYKVDAYICGHEHDLQIIKPKGRYTTQFLSGAGSEVRESGSREGTILAAAEPGFMAFSILKNKLLVQTLKAGKEKAEILHSFEIKK